MVNETPIRTEKSPDISYRWCRDPDATLKIRTWKNFNQAEKKNFEKNQAPRGCAKGASQRTAASVEESPVDSPLLSSVSGARGLDIWAAAWRSRRPSTPDSSPLVVSGYGRRVKSFPARWAEPYHSYAVKNWSCWWDYITHRNCIRHTVHYWVIFRSLNVWKSLSSLMNWSATQ